MYFFQYKPSCPGTGSCTFNSTCHAFNYVVKQRGILSAHVRAILEQLNLATMFTLERAVVVLARSDRIVADIMDRDERK